MKQKVILEFNSEIWFCYPYEGGISDILFTSVSYELADAEAKDLGYEVVKVIEDDEENTVPTPTPEWQGFTKGEWEAKQITKKQIIIGIKGYGEGDNYRKDNRCGQIAQIHGWNGDNTSELSSEDYANASLIANAPAMYDALKHCLKCLKMDSDMEEDFAPEIKAAKAILSEIEKG